MSATDWWVWVHYSSIKHSTLRACITTQHMHASYVTKILPWTKFENQLVRHYGWRISADSTRFRIPEHRKCREKETSLRKGINRYCRVETGSFCSFTTAPFCKIRPTAKVKKRENSEWERVFRLNWLLNHELIVLPARGKRFELSRIASLLPECGKWG